MLQPVVKTFGAFTLDLTMDMEFFQTQFYGACFFAFTFIVCSWLDLHELLLDGIVRYAAESNPKGR